MKLATCISIPCNCLHHHQRRRGWLGSFLQGLMIVVLVITIIFNILFIMGNSTKFRKSLAGYLSEDSLEDDENANIFLETNGDRNAKREGVITIEAKSSKDSVYVAVDGLKVYENFIEGDESRGIHVVVLNERTGVVMAKRIFDTYMPREDEAMVLFLNLLQEGRLVVFAVKDEGSASLKNNAKKTIKTLGSRFIDKLGWRDSWVFICQKRNHWLAEFYQASQSQDVWGGAIVAKAKFQLILSEKVCDWGKHSEHRVEFCTKYEGYGTVCSCSSPAPIDLQGPPLPNNRVGDIPIAVIAANRPHYLYRMLRGLLTTPGVNRHLITVYIDGFYEEPAAVAKLFQVAVIEHTPICSKNCRISQHYKRTLQETFDKYPSAEFMLILEEDLDVSKDMMDYFSQLSPVLLTDESVYCVSAWNDQGYEHSCKDSSLLYRVETMPGLGWLLKRKLFKEELEEKWPGSDKYWDWDMWMRMESNRKGRECIIPDVSRTYHFGAKGLNMNSYFQDLYFTKHALNTQTGITFDVGKVTRDGYEEELSELFKLVEVVDHTKDPCTHSDFIPDTKGRSYVIYIKQDHRSDYETWNNVAKCFKLWDLDVRGFHKSMWRFWIKENAIFVVGSESPYISYKPSDVTPIFIQKKEENKID